MKTRTFIPFLTILTLAFQLNHPFQVVATNSIAISSLTSAQGAVISNSGSSSQKPTAVSTAGDLNGDGHEDLLIGAADSVNSVNGAGAGITYVIYGTNSGIPNVDLYTMTSHEGVKIQGAAGNILGSSISNLKDVNGDGIDDVLIGVRSTYSVYLIFGARSGLTDIDTSTTLVLSLTQGIKISAPAGIAGGFGTMVKYAGDVNGDGIGDMMIAAASATVTAQGQGVVYVIFGKNGLSSIDLNSLSTNRQGFRILGTAGQQIGTSLNTAGDVNGDGIDDIMAGTSAPNTASGTIAIIYGRKNSVSDVEIASLSSTGQGFIIAGGAYQIGAPESIRSVGDLNSDGVGDITFGAPTYSNSLGSNVGIAYIIYGRKGGLSDINLSNQLSASQGFTITGAASGDLFGRSVAAGDIDGDGYLDVIVGASGSNSGAGGIYVLFGNKKGFSNINLAGHAYEHPQVLAFIGNPSDTMLGRSLKAATDFNGDNVNDFVAIGSSIAYALYGSPCESIVQCSSTSLSPVCYASKGCVCGEYNLYFQVNQCVTQCSEGYYLNNPICEPCPDSCSSCTSASTCQTCQYAYILEGTSCVPVCPEDYYFDGSTCQSNDVSSLNEINTINSVTDTVQYIADGTYSVAGVVASSDPGSVTSSMLAKMLQYIRYMNLPYSQRLEKTFKFQNSTYGPYGLGPKMPLNLILELPFHKVPNRFLKFHVFSCFLINFWDSLIFLAIIFGVLLVVALIEWIVTKIKQRRTFYPMIRLGRVSIQNFFIMQFYNVFGDVVMFIALDWKEIDLTDGDAILSFILSIICLCTGCAIIGIHIYILMRFYNLRRIKPTTSKLEKLSKEYEWSGVMYLHFKNNTFISQSFLLLYVLRNCLYNLVLVLLYDYPLVQTILIMSMSALMLTYLFVQRPFTTLVNQVQHIVYEIIFLLVNICVLIIAQINFEKSGAYPMRDRLCEAVIYTSLIFSFIPQVFLGIKVLIAALVWYKASRSKSYKISQKMKVKTNIPKRIQKERVVQFPENQNQSLDDSSAALTINQNVSSLYLRNQGSLSFKAGSQTDTSLQINKLASASGGASQQNQELQGTSFAKSDQKQFKHNQQYEDETLDVSRKERKEENVLEKQTNVFQKNKNVKQNAKRIRKRNPHLVE